MHKNTSVLTTEKLYFPTLKEDHNFQNKLNVENIPRASFSVQDFTNRNKHNSHSSGSTAMKGKKKKKLHLHALFLA